MCYDCNNTYVNIAINVYFAVDLLQNFLFPRNPILAEEGTRNICSTITAPIKSCSQLMNSQTSIFGYSSVLSPDKICSGINLLSIRTNVRNHFPRPSEKKRVKKHGWKTRMSTLAGRRILMRRILKGRHVLSH